MVQKPYFIWDIYWEKKNKNHSILEWFFYTFSCHNFSQSKGAILFKMHKLWQRKL